MRSITKHTRIFLFITQGIGIVFCGIFLAAYFGGLPSTNTLNSETSFIFSQGVIGAILIAFIVLAMIIAFAFKQK